MSETRNEAVAMRPLEADDVWIMVDIIGQVGLWEIANSLPEDLVKKARFKKPTMYKNGKVVDLPRERWTDLQIEAETDAQIANNQISISILGAIMSNIVKCKDNVNRLLARATDSTVEDITKMPAIKYVRLVNAFVDREGFSDFFSEAFNLVETLSKQKTPLQGATETRTDR